MCVCTEIERDIEHLIYINLFDCYFLNLIFIAMLGFDPTRHSHDLIGSYKASRAMQTTISRKIYEYIQV